MKKIDIKKGIDYLFPDDVSKVIAIIVVFIILVLSIIFTFIILKTQQKVYYTKDTEKNLVKVDLMVPQLDFENEIDVKLNCNIIKFLDKKDFESLFVYREFGEYTTFILDFKYFKRKIDKFFNK